MSLQQRYEAFLSALFKVPRLGSMAKDALRSSEVIAVELNRQLFASNALPSLHASLVYAANHSAVDPVLLQALDPPTLVSPCTANGGGTSGPKAFTGGAEGNGGNSGNGSGTNNGLGSHDAGGIGSVLNGGNGGSGGGSSSGSNGASSSTPGDAVALCRVIPASGLIPATTTAAPSSSSAGKPSTMLFHSSSSFSTTAAAAAAAGASPSLGPLSVPSISAFNNGFGVFDAFSLPPCVADFSSDSVRYAQKLISTLIRNGGNVNSGGFDVNAATASMGITSLHAAAYYGSSPAVIASLLEAGAMQAKTDANGLSAHDYAFLRMNTIKLALQQALALIVAAEQTNQQARASTALAASSPRASVSSSQHQHLSLASLASGIATPNAVPLATIQALRGCVTALKSLQQQCTEALLLLDGRYSSGVIQQHSRWLNQTAAITAKRRERIAKLKRRYLARQKREMGAAVAAAAKQKASGEQGSKGSVGSGSGAAGQYSDSPYSTSSAATGNSSGSSSSMASTASAGIAALSSVAGAGATPEGSIPNGSAPQGAGMASPLVSGRGVTLQPYTTSAANNKRSAAGAAGSNGASGDEIFTAEEDENSNANANSDEEDGDIDGEESAAEWARLILDSNNGNADGNEDDDDTADFLASAIGNPSLAAYGGTTTTAATPSPGGSGSGADGSGAGGEGENGGEAGNQDDDEGEEGSGEAESQARAEKLPLPPRAQLLEVGIQYLDPAAQALQANLLAVRNSYETKCSEEDWACVAAARWGDDRFVLPSSPLSPGTRATDSKEGYFLPSLSSASKWLRPSAPPLTTFFDASPYGGNSRLRSRMLDLGLLSPISRHELGWRKEYALVGKVWRLGHPAEADGDVAPLVDELYRAVNPTSTLLEIIPIRADAELRSRYLAEEDARLEAMADGTFDPYGSHNNGAHGHGNGHGNGHYDSGAVDAEQEQLDAEAEAALAAAGGVEGALEMHASGSDPRAIQALQLAQHALLLQQQKSGKKILKG